MVQSRCRCHSHIGGGGRTPELNLTGMPVEGTLEVFFGGRCPLHQCTTLRRWPSIILQFLGERSPGKFQTVVWAQPEEAASELSPHMKAGEGAPGDSGAVPPVTVTGCPRASPSDEVAPSTPGGAAADVAEPAPAEGDCPAPTKVGDDTADPPPMDGTGGDEASCEAGLRPTAEEGAVLPGRGLPEEAAAAPDSDSPMEDRRGVTAEATEGAAQEPPTTPEGGEDVALEATMQLFRAPGPSPGGAADSQPQF